jgi:hypothetical protein
MDLQRKLPILEVLDRLQTFSPIKICFNDFELYNDYDSNKEIEPGVFGEIEYPMIAIPKRLKSALDSYDIYVTRLEIVIVQHHHSIVYMYGEKIKKG